MSNKKVFTCIVCPMGCELKVREKDGDFLVSGNRCKRGEVYAKQELTAPTRNISSTIRVNHGFLNLVPVKTDKEIPKDDIFKVMKAINQVKVDAPVHLGDVLIHDVCKTGTNIVATRDIQRV